MTGYIGAASKGDMDTIAAKLGSTEEFEGRESGSVEKPRHRLRIILAGAIGNVLEWYDFGLYGLLAPVLASLFFPGHDRIAALLGVYGGFAVGFAWCRDFRWAENSLIPLPIWWNPLRQAAGG